jgi:hypothetical protein
MSQGSTASRVVACAARVSYRHMRSGSGMSILRCYSRKLTEVEDGVTKCGKTMRVEAQLTGLKPTGDDQKE